MGTWIDFKALRESLNFADVLRHYGVELKPNKSNQHHGYCPIPTHKGKRNSPSFSANLDKGVFHCFGCHAKGNAIDFAVLMQNLNPNDGADVRKAALILQEKFAPVKPKTDKKPPSVKEPDLPALALKETLVNAPLDFELKRLDPKHPYLDRRGFEAKTIAHFGLGFCEKGYLGGRIAIPLHTPKGVLVGYAGRLADGRPVSEDCPKYLFPGKRERNGVQHEFHKLRLLYNAHRLKTPVSDIVIVEGFPSVWWLYQMGIENAVALMGSSVSEEQAAIVTDLVPSSGRIWIMPDGNDAGKRCALELFERLAPHRFLHWLKLDPDKQPTDYPGGWLRERMR